MFFRSGGLKIYNNTFYDAGGQGTQAMIEFEIRDAANGTFYFPESIDFKNNIVSASGGSSTKYIRVENHALIPSPTLDNNMWFGISGGSFEGLATMGKNSFLGIDPQFVNASSGNFSIRLDSKAINSGADLSHDFSGRLRTDFDIGANEYFINPPKNLRVN